MSDVVWNVDGQRGDLGLHRLHWGLWSFALHLLPGGQSRECDLDVCAGEPERAPAKGKKKTKHKIYKKSGGKSNQSVLDNDTSAAAEVEPLAD